MQFPKDVYEASCELPWEMRCEFLVACLDYLFGDVDPMDQLNNAPAAVFIVARPSLDRIKNNSAAGKASAAKRAKQRQIVTDAQQSR